MRRRYARRTNPCFRILHVSSQSSKHILFAVRFQMLDERRSILRGLPCSSPPTNGSKRRHFLCGDERNLQPTAHVREIQPTASSPRNNICLCFAGSQLAIRWFGSNCRHAGVSLSLHHHLFISRLVHFFTAWNYEDGLSRRMARVNLEKPRGGDATQPKPGNSWEDPQLVFSSFFVDYASVWTTRLSLSGTRDKDSGKEISQMNCIWGLNIDHSTGQSCKRNLINKNDIIYKR